MTALPQPPPPPPPPEAQLIRARREALFMSMRQAAIGAEISPSAWAEVETAKKKVAPGVEIARKGTAKIVSQMALFLHIAPGEMRDRGRGDVADYMEAILRTVESEPRLTGRQRDKLAGRIRRDASDG
jgi:hypothetical protein